MPSTETHEIGPGEGTVTIYTYADGVAKKLGHDLIIGVDEWRATVSVEEDGTISSLTFDTSPEALRVLDSVNGPGPLKDNEFGEIKEIILGKVLGRDPIAFSSSAVEASNGSLTVNGELTLVGATRPAVFELRTGDGRVSGRLTVDQTEWGITPFSIMRGALKVRETIEISLDAALPSPGQD
ncbi:MAG TPA: YceI family protein [Solirubrobacteraceae bacterium]|nr:YceI family protein [Solirubrobacteraceae bacterium]